MAPVTSNYLVKSFVYKNLTTSTAATNNPLTVVTDGLLGYREYCRLKPRPNLGLEASGVASAAFSSDIFSSDHVVT